MCEYLSAIGEVEVCERPYGRLYRWADKSRANAPHEGPALVAGPLDAVVGPLAEKKG